MQHHTITPYLLVSDVEGLLAFVVAAFGAVVTERHARPDGSTGHAEFCIGDSIVMAGASEALPAHLYMYVDAVDTVFASALAAGATTVREVALQPYGDRMGGVQDPYGNTWWIATQA